MVTGMAPLDDGLDGDIRSDFLDESLEGLDKVSSLLVNLESKQDDLRLINTIFRPIHSLKGNSGFFGLNHVKTLAHELETILDLLRKRQVKPSPAIMSGLFDGLDELRAMLIRVREQQSETADEAAFGTLLERIRGLAQATGAAGRWADLVDKLDRIAIRLGLEDKALVADVESVISDFKALAPTSAAENTLRQPSDPKDPPPPGDKPLPEHWTEAHRTMRVSEENVDRFVDYVNELLAVNDQFLYIERRMMSLNVEWALAHRLRTVNETFAALCGNLQRSIMAVRRVSVKPLLQKAVRIVRDVARDEGKEIDVETAGDDVAIDKSLADVLDTPLTHLVRNAADHGIETPDERRAAGKDPKGAVRLTIAEDDRFVVMTVTDDGRGVNEEALRQKAVSLGLVRPDQAMTQADVVNLLFAPGVSTAKTVTDLSGRGVGMDVVKRAIESEGGVILCESEPGRGSVFTVRLPHAMVA